MHSGELPILEESPVPHGGYEEAIARNGALKQVVLSNAEYIKSVQTGGVPFQLPIAQDYAPEWSFLGDAPDDMGWSTRGWEE
jgi:hypothetical protein